MLLENKKKYISYNNNITFKSGLNIFFEYLIEKNKQQKYPNFEIIYGEHNTKFGKCFLAVINNNICSLVFNFNNINDYKNYLQNEWKEAILKQNKETIKAIVLDVFEKQKNHIKLFVKGTEFQIKIWQELLKIKSGEITSYSNLSKNINLPKANRAVGSAIGKNPISYIIPCHRVLRKDKKLGGYRWGLNLKTKMLEYENFKF